MSHMLSINDRNIVDGITGVGNSILPVGLSNCVWTVSSSLCARVESSCREI